MKNNKYFGWLSYLWIIIINLISLFIVVAIYNNIYSSFEIIVVSLLVLIYLSVDMFFINHGMSVSYTSLALDTEFKRIRKLLGNEPDDEEICGYETSKSKLDKAIIKMYIKFCFLFIIYSIVILNFLGSL